MALTKQSKAELTESELAPLSEVWPLGAKAKNPLFSRYLDSLIYHLLLNSRLVPSFMPDRDR